MAATGPSLIPLVAGIIGVGVIAQVLADRFQIPSIVFLIAAGVVLGPEVTGLVRPASFGGAISDIVGLSVAIIVFEGAFHLRYDRLREAPTSTLRLVTVGAAIAWTGTTAAVNYFFPTVGILVSAVVGALLVATGPTVITPILQIVPVRDRVGAVLDTEGIVNDVTAAILAVVLFEAIVEGVSDPGTIIVLFVERLGVGVVVGAVVAGALFGALRYVDLSPTNAPRNSRLLVLAGALVAFGLADAILAEAGVAAVATAGVILGNLDVPYEEDISDFKGDVTLLVLSFVFITLAALLDFGTLASIAVPGLAVVAAVAIVLRPLLVFLSTVGDRFTTGEKLFMSFVGPRGIIPASVATLFAIEFRAQGMDQAADVLVGTVFLVILLTVVFEGGFARQIAEYLDIIPMRVLIIGGGKVGRQLADRLEDRGENVVIIENNQEVLKRAREAGHSVVEGDGTDTETLRSAGAENAKIVVATTGDDDVNLLVAQLAESKFEPEQVLSRVNNPENVDAFEELGVQTISSTLATAQAIDNYIERPALAKWMGEIGRSGDVQEIDITSEALAGKTMGELGNELPEACLIALVSRDDEVIVPSAEFTLQQGDRLTIIGQRDSVREAMEFVHPEK